MAQAATVQIDENDSALTLEFVQEMAKQIKALDTYGVYEGEPLTKILDPLVMTKERKREIPIVGDPDEQTLARVKAFYNGLASLIERRCGLMAVPLVNITHEGFGRAFIMVGRLVAVTKTLRDVHRFGFESLEKMNEQAQSMIDEAVSLIEKYRAVAEE